MYTPKESDVTTEMASSRGIDQPVVRCVVRHRRCVGGQHNSGIRVVGSLHNHCHHDYIFSQHTIGGSCRVKIDVTGILRRLGGCCWGGCVECACIVVVWE